MCTVEYQYLAAICSVLEKQLFSNTALWLLTAEKGLTLIQNPSQLTTIILPQRPFLQWVQT